MVKRLALNLRQKLAEDIAVHRSTAHTAAQSVRSLSAPYQSREAFIDQMVIAAPDANPVWHCRTESYPDRVIAADAGRDDSGRMLQPDSNVLECLFK